MKLTHWITLMALLAMGGLVVGCEEEAAEETETPAAETAPEEAEEAVEEAMEEAEEASEEMAEETGGEEAAGGGDGVCGQAVACCEAYVNAMGANTPGLSVETTCSSVQNLQGSPGGDDACQQAIDGWRTGLEAAQMDVPGPCQGGEG